MKPVDLGWVGREGDSGWTGWDGVRLGKVSSKKVQHIIYSNPAQHLVHHLAGCLLVPWTLYVDRARLSLCYAKAGRAPCVLS